MMRTKRISFGSTWMWTCLLLAAGCGSSGEDAVERPVAAVPPAPVTEQIIARPEPMAGSDRPIILTFGDSLTAGHRVEASMSYPSQLAAKLADAGYEYEVINDGESGLTTSGGLARLERALALEPEIVVLALGGNDGLRGTPVEVTHENLRVLVQSFMDAGSVVILGGITLPRNYGPDYISAFENIYVGLDEEFDVEYIRFFLEGLVDLENPIDSIGTYMQSDGIHPTAEGYAIVADTVFRAIEPHLAR